MKDRKRDEWPDELEDAVLPLASEMVEFADMLEEEGVPEEIVVLAMALSHDIKATEHGAPTMVSKTNRDVLEDE